MMRTNVIFAGLLLALTVISCKTEDKKEEKTEVVAEKPVVDPNIFRVTLNATVKKDDSFQIYYKETPDGAFEEKNSFFIEFKGSDKPQDIVFNLPQDVLPSFLRLDFGTNKEQLEIVINNFKIDYLDKSFESKGKDFFNYFYSNELVKVDKDKAIVTPFVSDKGDYDPIFCSGEGLQKQIDLLIK